MDVSDKKIKVSQIKQTVKTSWRILVLVWKTDPFLTIWTGIGTLVPAVAPFLQAYIAKLLIDFVVQSVQHGTTDYQRLFFLIGLGLATYFGQQFLFGTQEFAQRVLWQKFPITINELVFRKIANLDVQYFEDSDFKDLLEKVRDSYYYRPQRLVFAIFLTLQSLIQVLIAFVAISRLNWFLVILVAAVSIPEFINQTYQSRLEWGIWSQNTPYRKRFWYLANLLQNARWLKEIKIFRLAEKFIGEIRDTQKKFYSDQLPMMKRSYGLNLIFGFLSSSVLAGVQLYVMLEALAKRVTVGDIGFYTGIVASFQNGLGGLFRELNEIMESSLYVSSIFEVLDTPTIVKEIENPKKLPTDITPKIEFCNVSFAYPGSKKKVLNNFNLIIEPGEKVAFVGENGAGKTTVVMLLTRFYDVTEGEILIDGINIKDLSLDNWYQHVGVLFQDFNRYEDKARENISYGKIYQQMSLDEIINSATLAGAHPMINKFEQGYEQMLGKTFKGGLELSGGQWQKIALSRAFLRNAPILVLDEPTSAIDAKAESEIFNRVEKLSKDKTVIIISHRFSTVRNADKIYVVNSGQIVEEGSHEELIKIDGQYATLFKLQAKGYR